ncbi:MAG: hypothetical protein WC911_01885 [Thermoleophilia bacterium]
MDPAKDEPAHLERITDRANLPPVGKDACRTAGEHDPSRTGRNLPKPDREGSLVSVVACEVRKVFGLRGIGAEILLAGV